MVFVTGKRVGSTSARNFSHAVDGSSTGVLLPRTRIVRSRFATSGQTGTQIPLRSMNKGGVAHASVRHLLHATATFITSISNRLTTDRAIDIVNALDRWKAEQASVTTDKSTVFSAPATHTHEAVISDEKATEACAEKVLPVKGFADRASRHAAAQALGSGAKWIKRADQPGFRRVFSNTPFHGFSRLPSELRGARGKTETDRNGPSAFSSADTSGAANTPTSSDTDLPLKDTQPHEAQNPSDTLPSRQLKKVFFLIDQMQRVDRIALQRGHHTGLHSGGLSNVVSGAASSFLARIGIHVGISLQRSRQFSLYMNESWLEMQFNTIEGTEIEMGMSAGLGLADASPLEGVQVRAGITVRADAVSVHKEQIKGVVIRIPCKWENIKGREYNTRVLKAKETAKQILLLLQESARDCDKPDGYRILDKLSNQPEFSEVSIQPVLRSIRKRSSSKLSIDGGFAIRASRSLFAGVMARLGLERVWGETSLHEDQSLKFIKEGQSVLASVAGGAGLSVGDSESVFAPFEAFGGVQGAVARDEEGLHMREVDGGISPWSFREVAFSDPRSLTAYVKRWCEVQGRQTCVSADEQHSYDEWEQDLFKQLKTWKDAKSRGNSDHKEYDYTYAARFRFTPEAVERLSILKNSENQLVASVDNLIKACEKSRQDKINPKMLSLPADQRVSEVRRLQAIDSKNRQALNDTLSRLRQCRAERSELSRSIDSFGAPVLYAYENAGHKEILGLRMLAGIFTRTAVTRRDAATVMKDQTLQAYIDKRRSLIDTTAAGSSRDKAQSEDS